jgi:cell division protein FtsI (penicillin-binding protein 3)
MINSSGRVPLRPLGKVLAARQRGETTDAIEQENTRQRNHEIDSREHIKAKSRLVVLAAVFFCLYCVLVVRMGHLAASDPQVTQIQPIGSSIIAQRANIVDRRGRILATNLDTHSLYAETAHLTDPRKAADGLVKIFPDLEGDQLYKDFTGKRKFLWIKKRISPEAYQAVHDLGDPGLRFGPREMRLYPNGRLAAHILGGASFGREGVHSAEVIGVAGVEKTFDERLRKPSVSVDPLKLSIDLSVQAAVESVLGSGMSLLNAKGAAAILMNVNNGEIISLASLPDFDPNHRPKLPSTGDPANSPLFNRAIQGVYELGSTFKIFAIAQALELKLVSPETMINVSGPLRWGKFKIRDFHNYGSELPVKKVISKSSNIGTARIAQEIGSIEQKKFLKSLGFFDIVPLEMVEASGGKPLLPKNWSELSTMTISYGHGLSATPLHLAAAYAAIGNGGYRVTPTLQIQENRKYGDRVISKVVSKQALSMLRSVVTDGTATMAEVPGYPVAGKTGTADKPSPTGRYYDDKVITNFAALFPAGDPKYVLVVTMDEPEDTTGEEARRTAGWTAVPVAAEIITRIAPLLGLRPENNQDPLFKVLPAKMN